MQRTRRAARVVIPLLAITLAAAACGSSKKAGGVAATTTAGSAAAATTAAAKTDTTVAATATTAKAADTTAAKAAGAGGVSPACKPDASIDATEGKNAGQFTADIACAATKPLKAAGDPIVIGVQNPQGDPNGSFPEYSSAIDAASKYINEELGGIGGDVSAGKVGRPVKAPVYLCPCHNSTFALDGKISSAGSPSPRGLDELEVEIRNDSEVWVKFQNYRAGVPEKIPA